jgi:hypothetical protein
MTKTYTAIAQYRFTKLTPPVVMPFPTNVDRSFVWDFEFGSLGFVWYLSFDIWNLIGGCLERKNQLSQCEFSKHRTGPHPIRLQLYVFG